MNHEQMEASLEFMPRLKELLTNYILFAYNEYAEITNWHLVEEYLLLKRNNQLHLLFMQELLDNTVSLEGGDWL